MKQQSKITDDLSYSKKGTANQESLIEHIPTKRPEWKNKIERLLENWWTVGLMMVVTIYALFFDDLRILFLPPEADLTCDWITLICIGLYTIELMLGCIAIEGYFLSFFFWLDLVAAVSMIPDVGFLVSAYEGSNRTDNASDLAKTSRASRVTRIIRIIRLIRLIRIVKIYK